MRARTVRQPWLPGFSSRRHLYQAPDYCRALEEAVSASPVSGSGIRATSDRRLIMRWCREARENRLHEDPKTHTGRWLMSPVPEKNELRHMATWQVDGQIRGWAWVTRSRLVGVWVAPELRRQGIGSRLFAALTTLSNPEHWSAHALPQSAGDAFYERLGVRNGSRGREAA